MSDKPSEKNPQNPNDKNEAPLLDHDYDGIQELDHSLPRWWLNLFYISIVVSAIYWVYYELGPGPSLKDEYARAINQHEITLLSQKKDDVTLNESDLRALLKSSDRIQAGKTIFQVRCVSCHGAKGEGGIGPNLTDDYWIHGGKMTEILNTIATGVPEKGMPSWKPILNGDEIASVTAFIKSLKGTHPPNAKAPEGVLVSE